MDGFTVSNSNKFLNSGSLTDSKSLRIDNSSNSINSSGAVGASSFADTLKQAIEGVNELQKTSDKAAQDVATGRSNSVAEAMIATEKADIAFRTMVSVRNKIIDAYQEIMKMQV